MQVVGIAPPTARGTARSRTRCRTFMCRSAATTAAGCTSKSGHAAGRRCDGRHRRVCVPRCGRPSARSASPHPFDHAGVPRQGSRALGAEDRRAALRRARRPCAGARRRRCLRRQVVCRRAAHARDRHSHGARCQRPRRPAGSSSATGSSSPAPASRSVCRWRSSSRFAFTKVFVDIGGFDGLVMSLATAIPWPSPPRWRAPSRRARDPQFQPLRALQGD